MSDSQLVPGLSRDKEAGLLPGGTGHPRWKTVLRTSQWLCQLPLNPLSPSPSIRIRSAPQSGSPSLHTPHSFSHVSVSPHNILECFNPSCICFSEEANSHTILNVPMRELRVKELTWLVNSWWDWGSVECWQMFNNWLSGDKNGEQAVMICSTGWFPWCEHFHHNSTSKFTPPRWHHWAWHWEEGCTVALRVLCKPAPAHLREAASLGFCLSARHLLTALPVCFTPECSSQEGALHSPLTQEVSARPLGWTLCASVASPWVQEGGGGFTFLEI